MADLEILALDPAVPQIRAPGTGDGYAVPRNMTMASGTTLSVQTVNAPTLSASSPVFTDGSKNLTTTGTINLATQASGTLAIGNGGTGATSQQTAINALAGAVTSGQYLRGNGTNVLMSAIQAGDVPTLNQNTTGTAAGLSSTLAVTSGGTGQTTYTDGQLLIGNSTGNTLTKATLTAGSGVTITNGTGSITISATSLGGDVVGPASATDEALARFDGTTGKLIQNSNATLTDAGALTLASNLTLSAGTANGVLYLNGSKVATSGTALAFDGTNLSLGAAWTTNPILTTAPRYFQYSAGENRLVIAGESGTSFRAMRFSNDATNPLLFLQKGRGTYASPAAVQTGDVAGNVRFDVYGGTNLRPIANISGAVETFTSDSNISGYLVFGTSPSGSANSTERMRLDGSGNLGIGTASPANRLDVFASADWQGRVVGNAGFNGGLIVEGNATGSRSQINLKTNNGTPREYYLRNVSGTFSLLDNTAGTIPFTVEAATPSNTIYANASGNVGIGTASPTQRLQVNGSSAAILITGVTNTSGMQLGVREDGNDVQVLNVANAALRFGTNATERARIDSSGNFGIGTTSPGSTLDVKGTLRLSGSTSGYVGLSPAAAAGSTTYTLPTADGTSGQFLRTNGSGTLSWASASAGGGAQDFIVQSYGIV